MEAGAGAFLSDTLQRKLKELEEENLSLRSEVCPSITAALSVLPSMPRRRLSAFYARVQASHLKSETETYEEKEQQLVNDCVKELSWFPPFVGLLDFVCRCRGTNFENANFPPPCRVVQSSNLNNRGGARSQD